MALLGLCVAHWLLATVESCNGVMEIAIHLPAPAKYGALLDSSASSPHSPSLPLPSFLPPPPSSSNSMEKKESCIAGLVLALPRQQGPLVLSHDS